MGIKRHVRNDVEKEECVNFFETLSWKHSIPLFENCSKIRMHAYIARGKRSCINLRWAWNGRRISIVDPYSF
jgi:hypothetical protein